MYYKIARKVSDITSPKLLLRKQLAVSTPTPEPDEDIEEDPKKKRKDVDTEKVTDERDFSPSEEEIERDMSLRDKAIKAIFS